MTTAMGNIYYEGETIEKQLHGRVMRYGWSKCTFGSWDGVCAAIDRLKRGPVVSWEQYRGWEIAIKVYPAHPQGMYPNGATTYHVQRSQFSTKSEAERHIVSLLGPDVASLALDNIMLPEGAASRQLVPDPRPKPTPSQVKRIKALASLILEHDGLGVAHMAGYEFKNFYLTHGYHGKLFLVTEVGSKNDEGSLGAIVCRTRRHMVIGTRGGIESLTGPKSKRQGLHNILLYGRD